MAGLLEQDSWSLAFVRQNTLNQGELQLEIGLSRGSLTLTKTYVIYPHSSVIREWLTLKNAGSTPLQIVEPEFLSVVAKLGDGLETLDFHWMTGAENQPGCWMLKTERLGTRASAPIRLLRPFPRPHRPILGRRRRGCQDHAQR